MQVDYSFLEYSYNPRTTTTVAVEQRLNTLGFIKRTRNSSGAVTVWTQNLCILLLKEVNTDALGITGIGFNVSKEVISNTGAELDPDDTGMYVVDNCAGFRTLLMPEEEFKNLNKSLEQVTKKPTNVSSNGLNYVSGVIYNNANPRMRDFYQELGFKFTKTGDRYYTFMSANNRFSLMLDTKSYDNKIPTIICDTDDVFNTTANFVSKGVKLKKLVTPELNFGNMNHKIVGYNCNASGDENSYTIENMIEGAAPGLDIIFRQRKQYLNILEKTLDTYYASS